MISVVVPIYNVYPYLSQCIDSILAQTYSDLEIILVDDGSPDDCPKLCDCYAGRDKRIKVIHKSNGGLSDARNAGMKIAGGEWTYFVDADDWLDRDAIRKLYDFAVAGGCEVVQENMYYAYAGYLLFRKTSRRERKKVVLDRHEAMRELIINDRIKNFAWGKLYKTALIRDLEFPKGRFFEDSFWQHLVFDKIERYGVIDEPLYYYRQREDSISGTPSDKIKDLLEGNKERMFFIKEKYPELSALMERKYAALYHQVYPDHRRGQWFRELLHKIKLRLNGPSYDKIYL